AGKYITSNNNSNPTCGACASPNYSDGANQTSCKKCADLTAPSVTGGTYSSVSPYNANTTCRYVGPNKDTPANCSGISKNTVSYNGSAWGTGLYTVTSAAGRRITANNTSAPTCAVCGAGTYTSSTNQTSCSNVSAGYYNTGCGTSATGAVCSTSYSGGGIGAGYYCSAGAKKKNPTSASDSVSSSAQCGACTSPLTTIGYGPGADEAGDCGRKFHAGDGYLYLRSTKKGSKALNVKVGSTTFYGNMSTTEKNMSDGVSKKLKVKDGNTTYWVHDDSVN
ncbi:MAG: hypothetical protein IKP05_04330, partial [Alphaproteobacteria bacterium]|nr:hypothetical protein [Alphaproteobacteria bacterium]